MAVSTAAKPLTRPLKVSPKPLPVAKMSREKADGFGCKVFFDRSLRSFLGGSVRGPVDRSKGGCCGCSSPSETIPAPGLWTVDSLALKTADGGRRASGGWQRPAPNPPVRPPDELLRSTSKRRSRRTACRHIPAPRPLSP
jgi:hypothetical protein